MMPNSQDLLVHIKNIFPTFSKSQKLIAKYITENYDKAAFMTAAKLGSAVGVSESTVVRFSCELGFEGYPQLQKSLQELIRSKLTAIQRIEVTNIRMGNRDLLQTVMMSDIEKLRITMEELDKTDFENTVDAILKAKNIYILGVRSSSCLASFLAFYLRLICDNVQAVLSSSPSDIFEQMLKIGPGDVLIGLSFPRYSSRTIRALKFAKNKGADVIAFTDSPLSPLVAYANHSLIARSDMASFVDSLVAPLSVINALIVALGMKKGDEVYATFHELESIWEEYGVYESGEDIK